MNIKEKVNEIIAKRDKAVDEIKNITDKYVKIEKRLFTLFVILIAICMISFIFTSKTMFSALICSIIAFCLYRVYLYLSNKFLRKSKTEVENVNKD